MMTTLTTESRFYVQAEVKVTQAAHMDELVNSDTRIILLYSTKVDINMSITTINYTAIMIFTPTVTNTSNFFTTTTIITNKRYQGHPLLLSTSVDANTFVTTTNYTITITITTTITNNMVDSTTRNIFLYSIKADTNLIPITTNTFIITTNLIIITTNTPFSTTTTTTTKQNLHQHVTPAPPMYRVRPTT